MAQQMLNPDLNPNDKEAEDRFKSLNEADEILSDTDRKSQYDGDPGSDKRPNRDNLNERHGTSPRSSWQSRETNRAASRRVLPAHQITWS